MSQIKSLIIVISFFLIIALLSYLVNFKSIGIIATKSNIDDKKCNIQILSKQPLSIIPYDGVKSFVGPILIQVTSPASSPVITIKPITEGVIVTNDLNDINNDKLIFIAPGKDPKFNIYLLVNSDNPQYKITLNVTLSKNNNIICEKQVNITVSP